jgi:acyl carrier protein
MPASTAIQEAVIETLKDVSRRPIDPGPTSDLIADLAFDSLQILEVIAVLEDRFGVSIPTDDLTGTRTVEHVVARVTALVESRSTS